MGINSVNSNNYLSYPNSTNEKNAAKTVNDTERITKIPELDKYEALIQRFLSGESQLESGDKPLTEDQIALRGLMREYRRTDSRSLSQIQASMQQSSKNFLNYWRSTGNTGPLPGRVLSADGSFHIFNSKAEKDEYMKNKTMSFLENVMSVINAGKSNGNASKNNGFDIKA